MCPAAKETGTAGGRDELTTIWPIIIAYLQDTLSSRGPRSGPWRSSPAAAAGLLAMTF